MAAAVKAVFVDKLKGRFWHAIRITKDADPQGGSIMVSVFRTLSLLGAMLVSLAHGGHHDVSSSAHLGLRRGRAKEYVFHCLQRRQKRA
jgi:hypothetical protein